MADPKPKSREPQPLTYRPVPKALGAGRVCLYDARGGLPDLLDPPFPNLLKGMPWVLVHFPSRRHVLVKSKAKGIGYLKAIARGEDETGVVPKVGKPPKKGKAARKTASKPDSSGKPHARGRARNVEPEPPAAEKPATPVLNADGTTPVPAGMTFDQAMQHVFPPGRITGELERLLRAKRTIVDREGEEIGSEEVHMVQINTLTRIISYHQGLPPPKEKPPAEKPKVTYEELEKMIMTSEAAQEMMQRLLDRAKQAKEQPAAPVGDVTNPEPAP